MTGFYAFPPQDKRGSGCAPFSFVQIIRSTDRTGNTDAVQTRAVGGCP
ncbi:hypothetical protein Z947_3079 [Sulfitobacter geojensis]|nr:hypothetical protein Z947_3079 [Sulfitobacter geojensis]